MNETIKLSPRQKEIVNLVARGKNVTRFDISNKLSNTFSVSKATLARDLKSLVEKDLIQSVGSGPSTAYKAAPKHPLLSYVDLGQYFTIEPDNRVSVNNDFNPDIFSLLPGLIDPIEQKELNNSFSSFDQTTKKLDHTIYERELERSLTLSPSHTTQQPERLSLL